MAEALALLPPHPYDATTWGNWTAAVKDKTGRKGRGLFMPLRHAVTGREKRPGDGRRHGAVADVRGAAKLWIRMAEQAKFLEGNLFRHITVMSLTASVGLMAVFLVDFVDMIFISMLGKAELAAAVGYAGAILFFTTSFGIGMAIAAGALGGACAGAGRRRHWRANARPMR